MLALSVVQDGGGDSATPFVALPHPAVTGGFREAASYSFTLEHPGACCLIVDDVVLEVHVEGSRHHWSWEPRFFAGTVLAELVDERGAQLASYRLDVAPAPDKLGQAFFQQVVEELRLAAPEWLLGAESAQQAFGESGSTMNVHLAFARLKRFGFAYLGALKQVRARPLSVLRSERRLVPAHGVRRIDARTLRAVVRSPAAATEIARQPGHGASAGALYDVPVSHEDLDTPAHRILLSGMFAVMRRIRWVQEELARVDSRRPDLARTAMAPRLPVRTKLLGELEAGLLAISRSSPFSKLNHRETTAAGLNVISSHPAYARAYRLGWQALRAGIEGVDADELLSVSPTWEIYERWCFLQIVEAVQTLYPGLAWTRKTGSALDRVSVLGKNDGLTIQVHLQLGFAAVDQRTEGTPFYSISAKRRPDIVVIWQSHCAGGMLVFDAKYRVARNYVLEAMESAHLYKDSLRWNGIRPAFAMLLVPAGGGVPRLEEPDFHAEHKVGVIALSPGLGRETVVSFLNNALAGS